MKKLILLVLTLCLLCAACAAAEPKTYITAAIRDREGSFMTASESKYCPTLIFSIDEEAGTCSFGTEKNANSGTFSVVEENDSGASVEIRLDNGAVMRILYSKTEDMFYYTDLGNNLYAMISAVQEPEAEEQTK